MNPYRIYIRPSALQEIKNLPGYMRQRVKRAISELAKYPYPSNSKTLNLEGYHAQRLRIDQWRVLYTVLEADQIIETWQFGNVPPMITKI